MEKKITLKGSIHDPSLPPVLDSSSKGSQLSESVKNAVEEAKKELKEKGIDVIEIKGKRRG